jgi:hypothetical protein
VPAASSRDELRLAGAGGIGRRRVRTRLAQTIQSPVRGRDRTRASRPCIRAARRRSKRGAVRGYGALLRAARTRGVRRDRSRIRPGQDRQLAGRHRLPRRIHVDPRRTWRDRARSRRAPRDDGANACIRRELALARGRARRGELLLGDATFAATLYERLAPYVGRPVTAGRAVCSYGAVDLSLGGLAALLGRKVDAVRHLEDAIRLNDTFGCVVWRTRAERDLSQLFRNGPLIS